MVPAELIPLRDRPPHPTALLQSHAHRAVNHGAAHILRGLKFAFSLVLNDGALSPNNVSNQENFPELLVCRLAPDTKPSLQQKDRIIFMPKYCRPEVVIERAPSVCNVVVSATPAHCAPWPLAHRVITICNNKIFSSGLTNDPFFLAKGEVTTTEMF